MIYYVVLSTKNKDWTHLETPDQLSYCISDIFRDFLVFVTMCFQMLVTFFDKMSAYAQPTCHKSF